MTNDTYHHTGDLGDVIASLPSVRALGGGHYRIGPPTGTNSCRESLLGSRYAAIKPLLEAQPYIGNVSWGDKQGAAHDFSVFRRNFIFGENLVSWQARAVNATPSTEPWLTAKPAERPIGRAVFARSVRYHNKDFPWRDIIAAHAGALFVGTPHEHVAFCAEFGRHTEYRPTDDLLELAELIAGCRVFVGNQSCPFWIAAGLGVPIIQETSPTAPNSIILRDNAQYPVAPKFLTYERSKRPAWPSGSKPMNVIIPFHKGDADQAIKLVEWIQELGPQDGRFFLMTRQDLQNPALLPAGWEWLTDWDKMDGDWSNGGNDASAPNSMWRGAAREMARLNIGPWLWLEPDAVPCREDWLAVLTREYESCGKHFMGTLSGPPEERRMSGAAIYSPNTSRIVMVPFNCDPIPFDQAGANEFLPNAHITSLICDQFRCEPFTSRLDFDNRVPPDVVVHHGCKDGSIYPFLRSRVRREEGGDSKKSDSELIGEAEFLPRSNGPFEPDEPFLQGVRTRLDWIEQHATSGFAKMHFRAELEKRGLATIVKAPPKKARLRKAKAKAH